MNKVIWTTVLLLVPHTVSAQPQQDPRKVDERRLPREPRTEQPLPTQEEPRLPPPRQDPQRMLPPNIRIQPPMTRYPYYQNDRMCNNERIVFVPTPRARKQRFANLTPHQREQIRMAREDFRKEVQRILKKP
jgi:hypothetical protein